MRENRLQEDAIKWVRQASDRRLLPVNIHIDGHGNKGFPDLIIFGDGHAIVVELKSNTSGYKLQPDQKVWRNRFKRSHTPHYSPNTLSEFKEIVKKEFPNEINEEI